MTYNDVTFNHLYWTGKTLREFIAHEGHHGLTINQLEEAFFIINPGARVKLPDNGNDKPVTSKGKSDKTGSDNKPVNIEDKE